MTSRRLFLTIFAALAAATAVAFFAISIDSGIYAPGADDRDGHAHVLGSLSQHVPDRFQHDLAPSFVLRKLYSVVAFAVFGFFSAPLLPRARRIRACALLVTGFSLLIEIVQRLTVSHESNLSSIFDIACGTVGGTLGALAWNVAIRRFARRSPGPTSGR